MEALQTVFDYIREVLLIIKNFLESIFPKEEGDETTAPAEGE